MDYNNIQNLDQLLERKYGPEGSPEREAFQAKAQAFYFCELLKEEREKANLTQSELAARIEVKKEFISRIENGKADIQLSTFLKILHGLGLSLAIVPTK